MNRRVLATLMCLFILGGLMTVGSGQRWLAAQNEESLPPHVIDVWPLPGVELSGAEPLTITFDQAMDRASVEAAVSFEPALEGIFTWQDDRSLMFSPVGEWPRAAEYRVTIGTGAVASNGLSLEEAYKFEARTIGALAVTAVTPEDGAAGVAADARIVVTFNRPVVPLVSTAQQADLPSPLVIAPPLAGKGEWLNTSIYAFTPSEPLRGGTTYTVTVPAGLEAVTGARLDEEFRWSFRTLPPQILEISPQPMEQGVLLDRQVRITFSQPMDKASTEAAFSLLAFGQQVPGSFQWSDDATQMTFTPASPLAMETVYTIHISPEARSASGEARLDRGQSTTFSTVPYPGIADTHPRNGDSDVRPGSGASITFRSPMNTETFRNRVVITPETNWRPAVWDNQSLGIQFSALPNTTYTITFLAGAEDIYGNAITTDYTFRFTTGNIATWAYPVTGNNRLVIVGAHRENTRFPLVISGKPTVSFELYRVAVDDLPYTFSYYGDQQAVRWMRPENLIRIWTQTFDSQGREGVSAEVLLASEQGGQLPEGNYWVVMRGPDRQVYQFPLVVASLNLAVKRAPGEVLVWVTDMVTAEAVPGATVTVLRDSGTIARGQTGADGVWRASLPAWSSNSFLSIIAQGQGEYGAWFSYAASNLPTRQGYLYTDRPIYRPGQTVYFRGALRDRRDMDYRVPNIRSVHVTIESTYSGQKLYEGDVPVTDFGTFSGELQLPFSAPIGEAIIRADQASVMFTIAEFRVPEYEVTVTPQQEAIFQGDALNALVEASYYAGGAVSNATVEWSAYGEPTSFPYSGPGRYRFDDETQGDFSYYAGDGTALTDANGKFLVTTGNTRPQAVRPMQLTVEATVVDESQQAISGRTSVLAHPANVYVGLRSDRYFGKAGEPMPIELIAVTAASEPLADKRIDLTVVEIRWSRAPVEGEYGQYRWTREEIEVATAQVVTGRDGKATYLFTPPDAGIFRVRASALDEYERRNSSTLRFWVTGRRPVWWGEPSRTIDLIADKESYRPGDVAQVLVPIPFAGASTVLVSIERAGIINYEVRRVEGSTLLYELPITEAHVPTIHFDVTVVKGIDEESLNPDYRTGKITLDVEPVRQALTITVTPSTTLAQPREAVTFDLQAVDASGEPVQAEFGVALTDKAILALLPPNSGTLLDAFYGRQGNYVSTDYSLSALLDRLSDEYLAEQGARSAVPAEGIRMYAPVPTMTANLPLYGGGLGGQPAPLLIREQFEQTPLWAAHVVTGRDGRAAVSVDLPDNLTTWTFDARALTVDTRVGQATTEIVSTLPLLIRPVTPRFFVVDDVVQLAAVVNNNTGQAQRVTVTLEASGVTLQSDAAQTITIEAGARGRVNWIAVAEDVEYVDLTFIARSEQGYQDASKPTLATGPDNTIPVYRYTAPDVVGTAGVLREAGSRTEAISLPPRLDTRQGELTIRLDPSLAVTATDTFDYLKNYPHQCIEQTVSRFLPNAVTYRALRNLGIQDPVLEANLYTALRQALTKLTAEQNPDGGWGWFGHMESDPLVTAYAALGLIEARDSGLTVDAAMIARALNFVRSDLIRPAVGTPAWQLNRQAFYFYVLARGGQGDLTELLALHNARLEMSYQGRAYLLMAFHELYPEQGAVSDLVSDLITGAILSATGAHWEERTVDWWNWGSDTRTTALVLSALARTVPDSDLLPNAVRWLMVARQGDHWKTTQENVWAVIALTDWMVLTGELRGNYEYALTVNRDTLARTTVTPETVRDGQVIRVAVRDLLRDELNRVTVVRGEGEGALYYTAHLNLRLPAAEAEAISRGIMVSREYFLTGAPNEPITAAKVGDVITVRLTITLPEDIYYFVLEDPIPAGTEGVDTSLLTTSRLIEGPQLERQRQGNYDPYWYWGWWWFDHTEMRDEQVNLYADFLPRGTYVYTYQIRASLAGEFQTMPAHAYAFYFPEVFGRTAGTLFTVQEAGVTQ